MMQKNGKKIFTAVIAALFVLSVSYFALLSPTTAWYYQEYTPSQTFTFKNFNESFTGSIGSVTVPLRAATRFADGGEYLFDEVAHVIRVQTTNAADSVLAGLVHVDVSVKLNNNTVTSGIRWCAFSSSTQLPTFEELSEPLTGPGEPEETTTGLAEESTTSHAEEPTTSGGESEETWDKGHFKPLIEQMLRERGVTVVDYRDVGKAAYTSYNNSLAIPALEAYQKEGFYVAPDTSRYIYVVIWAEYGDFIDTDHGSANFIESTTTAGKGASWESGTYTASITLTARPYTGAYAVENTKQLTISSQNVQNAFGKVTIYYPDGTHVTPPSSPVTVNAGAQLRIVADDGYRFDAVTGDGVVRTGDNQTVCSIAKMSGDVTLTVEAVPSSP